MGKKDSNIAIVFAEEYLDVKGRLTTELSSFT
jgi:hypothetical protein